MVQLCRGGAVMPVEGFCLGSLGVVWQHVSCSQLTYSLDPASVNKTRNSIPQ